MSAVVSILLLALLAGSLVYSVLAMVAARRYLAVRPPELRTAEAVSVLKPLAGLVAGRTPAVSPVVLVLPGENELKLNLDRFLPDDGIMRVRVRAARSTMSPDFSSSMTISSRSSPKWSVGATGK